MVRIPSSMHMYCIPGGSSVPAVNNTYCGTAMMELDDFKSKGEWLRDRPPRWPCSDTTVDRVGAIHRLAHFLLHIFCYKHESCGHCTPCREKVPPGSRMSWFEWNTEQPTHVKFPCGKKSHDEIEGHTSCCAFGDAPAWPVQVCFDIVKKNIEDRIDNPGCVWSQSGISNLVDPFFTYLSRISLSHIFLAYLFHMPFSHPFSRIILHISFITYQFNATLPFIHLLLYFNSENLVTNRCSKHH